MDVNLMNEKRSDALIAFEEDIKKRGLWDWIIAHTSFAKPLHRYDGELTLYIDRLYFEGVDKKKNKKYSIEIRKNQVESIFYGFDDIFKRGEDRALGLSFQPLRLKIRKKGSIIAMYLIIGYRRALRTTNNKEWFQELTEWLNSE
jgi:hypothetical protein